MPRPSPELAKLFEPVLDWLKDPSLHPTMRFDMLDHHTEHACGTSCCIVGALSQFNPDMQRNPGRDTPLEKAEGASYDLRTFYGMDTDDAMNLFYENMLATPAEAVATVEHWIKTGDVKWTL